tara:strand:+ start:4830 stop:7217 length:2388 start_codon:yes stop_codon:yes gene_type:complete
MALSPVAYIAPNYTDYGTWWLKAYSPGTTTPLTMALDSAGATTVAKLQLNANGFLVSASNALVIPYIDGAYDLWLFPTEAEADANDTSSAVRVADNVVNTSTTGATEGALSIFSTVAAMKLSTSDALVVGSSVHTQGYYSVNDGGGASYVVEASQSVDGWGDHLLAGGNVVKIDISGRAESAQYGARRQAGVNDYSAIEALLASPHSVTMSYGTSEVDWWFAWPSNKVIAFDGWIKVVNPRAFNFEAILTASLVLNGYSTTNSFVINPQIDCNFAPSANGLILRDGTTDCRVDGGRIMNCANAKTSLGGYGGGRALNIEAGSGGLTIPSNNKIDGVIIENCYSAISVAGSDDSPEKNNTISNITVYNCEMLIGMAGNGPGFPHSVETAGCQISNITGFNVGKSVTYTRAHGIINGDRACNVLIDGIKVANTSDYTSTGLGVGSITRGEWANIQLKNVDVTGDVTQLVNLDTYAELDSISSQKFGSRGLRFDIKHRGTCVSTIQYAFTYNPALSGGTNDANPFNNRFKLDTDTVSDGLPLIARVSSYPNMYLDLYEQTNITTYTGNFLELQSQNLANMAGKLSYGGGIEVIDGENDGEKALTIQSFAPTITYKDISSSAHWWRTKVNANVFDFEISVDSGANWSSFYKLAANQLYPSVTNDKDLGVSGSISWRNVYSQNAVTVTSDARLKQNVASIDQALLDFAMTVEIKQYTLVDEVEDQIHYGLIVDDAFIAQLTQVIDIDKTAAFIHTLFTNAQGQPITINRGGVILGDVWQVRYDEWQNILLEAMRRKLLEL